MKSSFVVLLLDCAGTVEITEGVIYSTTCELKVSFNATAVDIDLYLKKATSYGLMFSLT